MKLIVTNIRIPIEEDSEQAYIALAAQKLRLPEHDVCLETILSKSIDLRDQEQICYKLIIAVEVPADYPNHKKFEQYIAPEPYIPPHIHTAARPVIVGFGPAGMFAALELIEHNIAPIIIERGKPIEERINDVSAFRATRKLNEESNIQFGEGGAGSFSDGKLFSRRNNNTTPVGRVLEQVVRFGAPADILYKAKPHLGTDVLCRIVKNIRTHILSHGGTFHYESRLTDFSVKGDSITSVQINDSDTLDCNHLYLATGHSARDIYRLLDEKNIVLEQRPISVGLRIEHPAHVINRLRYGTKYMDSPILGAATYSLNYTNKKKKRGVYTFCQCPGGEIINASSHHGHLVVNGMSYSDRSSPFSNAAMAVTCKTSDYPTKAPLAGLAFQETIEQATFTAGGGSYHAPAQNLLDFIADRETAHLNPSSFAMGLCSCNLRTLMPPKVTTLLLEAFEKWKTEYPTFITTEATLIAAETRTSSPVKIVRNKLYESISLANLYPIGEGSGYTGGITSSAADGLKAVNTHIHSGRFD